MRPVARLTVCHVLADALLLTLGYYWLGVGEGRMPALLWSFLVAFALVTLTAWTYGAVFVFFSVGHKVAPAYRIALRHLTPLTVTVLAVLAIYYGLARWGEYSTNPASTLASYLTLKLRKPVSPHAVSRIFNVALWVVRWVTVPALLAPLLANIATHGWAGCRVRALRWFYWIAAPAALLCAIWLPLRILGWVPQTGSFTAELASFVLRAFVAYLLFMAGWLALAFVTSAGKPRFTQPSTVASL